MSELDGVRRLLVVRLDNIGDVVLLTPALRALRGALPSAHLCLLASPAGAQVAPLLPWVDEVRTLRALWQDVSGALRFDPGREYAFVADLAAGAFDAAVIATSFAQSAHPVGYACYLGGIPIRAGFAADFAGAVLSHPIPPPPDEHQADRTLALLAALGIPPAGKELELGLTLPIPDGRYVVLAPGASCPARCYDPERFAAVAVGIAQATGLAIKVVGSEKERALAERVCGSVGHSLAGETTVPELAALIAGAALVVTNNSGPLHFADAFGRPTVVLYSGVEREGEFAPRRSPARLLRRPTACSPCRQFTCPYGMECLDIPPEEVVRAALELLPVSCAS